MRDVFLCHASEDKAAVVRPLARAFAANTISCWLDEAEIKWGDSISDKVNQGLRDAHFAILVLSPATLQKHWQQREINAVLNLEAGSGEVRALPLLVGTNDEVQTIIAHYPLLNDKLYQRWQGDPAPIVEAMQQRLGGTPLREALQNISDDTSAPQKPAIHIPRLKKPFTDLDKDRFIKQAFAVIRDYFKEGLKQLDTAHPEIDVDFT
ncbi:MAG: toll/interleukin-1 receptor domain-containing protein, partial [Candidatus Competibacteraceae bacterium]|nr:toll/interleukin-1 receptor domain-containing protein [Candidatus Competibacteraceae bacterium]